MFFVGSRSSSENLYANLKLLRVGKFQLFVAVSEFIALLYIVWF